MSPPHGPEVQQTFQVTSSVPGRPTRQWESVISARVAALVIWLDAYMLRPRALSHKRHDINACTAKHHYNATQYITPYRQLYKCLYTMSRTSKAV